MTDDPGFRRETHATVEPTLEQQVAHWKARAEAAERTADSWREAADAAERREEQAERERDTLREALEALLKETEPDAHRGAATIKGPARDVECVWCDARAALAAVSPPQKGERALARTLDRLTARGGASSPGRCCNTGCHFLAGMECDRDERSPCREPVGCGVTKYRPPQEGLQPAACPCDGTDCVC